MSDKQKHRCIVCRTELPSDAPKTNNNIKCHHCDSPNPNPKNLLDDQTAPYSARGSTQIIELKESVFSVFFSVFIMIACVATFVLFFFRSASILYLLLASIIAILPLFKKYFVPAHWEKVLKWASSQTGSRYTVSYSQSDISWICYLESFAFQVWLLGTLMSKIVRPDNSDALFVVWLAAVIASCFTVYLIELAVEVVATIFGKIISRPK